MAKTINGYVYEDDSYAKYVDLVETKAPYIIDTLGYSSVIFVVSWDLTTLMTGQPAWFLDASPDKSFSTSFVVSGVPGTDGMNRASHDAFSWAPVNHIVTPFPRFIKLRFDPRGSTAVGTLDFSVSCRR